MITVEKIEQLCINQMQHYEPQNIFKKLISDNPAHFNLWQTSEKLTCNQEISQDQLAFQCLTCSDDQSHLICSQCFIISNHQNHNCYFSNKTGKCQSEFLNQKKLNIQDNHQFQIENSISQRDVVPNDLAERIEQFIIASSIVYHEIMKQIENKWTNFRLPLMQLYHLCQKFKINKLKKTIDKRLNYQIYYKLLQKSQYLHQMIFSLIDWLIKDRTIFINLIAQILQKQLPNCNYSIYEGLIKYQALYEAISPEIPIFIGKLIQLLTSNLGFFQFVTNVNLKIYSSFFLLAKNSNTKTLNTIYQYIDFLNQEQEQEYIDPNFAEKNKKQINEFDIHLERYLNELQQIDYTSLTYISCEAIEWFKESTDEIIMKSIVEQLDKVQVFNFIESTYQIIHMPLGQLGSYPWDGIKFFGSKFRCSNLDKYNMVSLKKALGINFDQFKNQNADFDIIKTFEYDKQLLTKLINCFSKGQSSNIKNKIQDFKLSANEMEEFRDYLHFEGEVYKEIKTGIISLFCDKECTQYLKSNFIKVILLQTYKLIKNNKNNGLKFEDNMSKLFSQFKNSKDDEQILIFKARKIYCYLKKNATMLDKFFIQTLCLHFLNYQYSQSEEFLEFLKQLFDDPIDIIREHFQQILQRCIQNYVTVWMMIDDKIDQQYYGCGEQNYLAKLESFDTAFGKLYIFLFGEKGLFDIYKVINNMNIPDIKLQSTIYYLYIQRIIISDIDIYNLSIPFFNGPENLPIVLNQALQKILQNIMNFDPQTTIQTIRLKFEELGINYSLQNSQFLNFLELDENTRMLKLKKQYPPLFDPVIFTPKQELKNQLVEKLYQRGMDNRDLLFGNGLQWDIQQFNKDNTYILQKHILNILCSKQNIIENLQFSQKFKTDGLETSAFLYNIILAASYFRPEELKNNKILILQHLNQLYKDQHQNEANKQNYEIIIEQFKSNLFLNEIQYNNLEQEEQLKKDDQIQHQIQDPSLNTHSTNNQYCNYCKLQIQDKCFVAILLSKKNSNNNNLGLPEKLGTQLINQDYNLMQVSVNGCQHKYHLNCLTLNQQQQSLFQIQIPKWYNQACQICQQSFNIFFPLHKQISQLELQFFNQALINYANETGLQSYLVKSNQNQQQNIIFELYFQIIIDLLQQLFIDINRFKKLDRTIVFNQFIYILEENAKNINQNSILKIQPKVYKLDKNASVILDILNSIQNNIIINQDRKVLKDEIISIVLSLNCKYDQYKQTFLDIFSITDIEFQECKNKNQIIIQDLDPIIEFYQQLFDRCKLTIKTNLGQNFAEFHKKYLTKGCDVCKHYNFEFQNSKDILVCVMCEKVFCMRQCKETKFGNLNEHALQEHGGGCFYVSLITGQITLIQHPVSLHSSYDLFYDEEIGQREISQLAFKEWQKLIIDEIILAKIVESMIYNQYGFEICNRKSQNDQKVTIDGGL